MRTGLTIGLPEDIEMTMEAVGARAPCNVYGSTETYRNCAVTDADDPLPVRLHTQGRPLPGMEIRVVQPGTRRPLAAGEVGELCVRGHVTAGSYRAPELDAEAFDAEGYFLTGDLGLLDGDGRVRFRARRKELIKTAGINVAPLEVEQVLLQHPAVKQAHVVRVPDRERDEIVAAALELEAGARADPAPILPSAASGSPATSSPAGSCSAPPRSSRGRRPARSASRPCARSWRGSAPGPGEAGRGA